MLIISHQFDYDFNEQAYEFPKPLKAPLNLIPTLRMKTRYLMIRISISLEAGAVDLIALIIGIVITRQLGNRQMR
jgi:hypothetical protein